MHYTLLFYLDSEAFASRTSPEGREQFWGRFGPYMSAIQNAGIVVSGAGLQTPDQTVAVESRNGQRRVQDGPFADTKEQLAGFMIIDVPDRDAAVEWALRYVDAIGGRAEVRPNLPPRT